MVHSTSVGYLCSVSVSAGFKELIKLQIFLLHYLHQTLRDGLQTSSEFVFYRLGLAPILCTRSSPAAVCYKLLDYMHNREKKKKTPCMHCVYPDGMTSATSPSLLTLISCSL